VTSVTSIYRSTIGKKMIMAVSGLIMVAFLVVHMLGNLKIFFGAADFDHYAGWLTTIGEPVLHKSWYLWVQRVVLLGALLAHIWSAAVLSRQDLKARPIAYQARRKGGYATSTMRWGGIILGLFIVYHLLDLTAGVLNPAPAGAGTYGKVVYDFHHWYVVVAYTVALLALCLHIGHGFWSAANTLGYSKATTAGFRSVAVGLAAAITIGFLAVPFGVVFGIVNIG
jgi:succinate dehydrogenase / fumarate reductase cytochrome b subunit